jgi:hypothetical protein
MRRKLPAALAAGVLAIVGTATITVPTSSATPSPTAQHGSDRGWGPLAVVRPQATDRHWNPLTPEKWAFEDGQVIMTERGDAPEGPRRPFEYAIVDKGPELTSFSYRADVRIDEPVSRNDRDVILVFNYRSPTRFYYAHLSQDNMTYPHNRIFVVDDADRERIDDQWNGTTGAPAAIDDTEWHDVRLDYDRVVGADRGVRRRVRRAADDRDGHQLLRRPGRLRLVRQPRPNP